MERRTLKIDRNTAQYLVENFKDMPGDPFDFKCCEYCGSRYLDVVGHECGDSVEVEVEGFEEDEVKEPVKIIPRSMDEERDEAIDDMFGFLKGGQ